MELVASIVILLVGFLALIQGAAFLVEGAAAVARRYKLPEIAIGLTVVSLGTSLPEIVINVISSARGENEVVFANVIGSNIFNVYLVMGLLGAIRPMFVQKSTAYREIPFSLLATVVVFVLLNDQIFFNQFENTLSQWDGLILLALFALFMGFAFLEGKDVSRLLPTAQQQMSDRKMVSFLLAGFIGVPLGGYLVVEQALSLAEQFAVSRKMIALLILAPGSALPELATSLVAVAKNRLDLAVGNIVGSCMFNLLLVLGISSFMGDLTYSHALNFDYYFFFFGVLLFFVTLFSGKRLRVTRFEGIVLFLFFLAYIYFLFIRR